MLVTEKNRDKFLVYLFTLRARLHVARFTCPWQTCFAASDVYFHVWSGYRARNFIQSNVSIQVTCSNLICGQTSLKVGGITRNITRLSNAAKILHIFVLRVYRSLKVRVGKILFTFTLKKYFGWSADFPHWDYSTPGAQNGELWNSDILANVDSWD